ncbi:MAG: hypothetical protein NXH75_03520 [Halobacteriovoraceae bacterium]|nr:hypothetical protein [Halobacteriovoraceae bacterium]
MKKIIFGLFLFAMYQTFPKSEGFDFKIQKQNISFFGCEERDRAFENEYVLTKKNNQTILAKYLCVEKTHSYQLSFTGIFNAIDIKKYSNQIYNSLTAKGWWEDEKKERKCHYNLAVKEPFRINSLPKTIPVNNYNLTSANIVKLLKQGKNEIVLADFLVNGKKEKILIKAKSNAIQIVTTLDYLPLFQNSYVTLEKLKKPNIHLEVFKGFSALDLNGDEKLDFTFYHSGDRFNFYILISSNNGYQLGIPCYNHL